MSAARFFIFISRQCFRERLHTSSIATGNGWRRCACQISWKPLGDGKSPDISQSRVLRKKGGGAPVLARPLPFRLYPYTGKKAKAYLLAFVGKPVIGTVSSKSLASCFNVMVNCLMPSG